MKKNKDVTIAVEGLSVAYDIKPVLWDVDLEIERGKLTAIIGPNGAGKTTLLKSMLGIIKPITGTVTYPYPEETIAYVPQSSSVDWDFPTTVLDVVMMGRYGHLGWFKRPTKEDEQIAKEKLEKIGMLDFADRQISQLSGGQQQRVFLARALAQEADIYLLDEPFKGVDVTTEAVIIDLLRELIALDKTVVLVHHNLDTVKEYFDQVILLNVMMVANGETNETFTQENVDRTYSIQEHVKDLRDTHD